MPLVGNYSLFLGFLLFLSTPTVEQSLFFRVSGRLRKTDAPPPPPVTNGVEGTP
jgi:hypothetical protein